MQQTATIRTSPCCPATLLPRALPVFAAVLLSTAAGSLSADEIILKNGLILNGTAYRVPGLSISTANQNNQGPIPNFPFWLIDDGVRRYFLPTRLVAEQLAEAELAGTVTFELKHQKQNRTTGLNTVSGFSSVEPFDKYGRRTVSLLSTRGPINIIQGITRLRPDYAQLEGLNLAWDYCIDTRVIPEDTLQKMIAQASDREKLSERKAAVTFYLQGEMYTLAQEELDSIANDFPTQKAWCEELRQRIAEEKARGALVEIKLRRQAGQHLLAYQIARLFPEDRVSADVLREARDIVADYDAAIAKRDRVLMLLDTYQAKIDSKLADQVRPLRSMLTAEIHYNTIGRLEPFLRSERDATLKPDEKLALAYSAWVLGSANAVLDLEAAVRFWEARLLVLEYLRTVDNPFRREEIVAKLNALEGINVERIAQMIPNIPLPFEPPQAQPGEPAVVEVATEPDQLPVKYTLILPPEYTPHQRYPLLVVLNSVYHSPQLEAQWWAGDAARPGWAQRRGYIVVAPHYVDDKATEYGYQESSHQVVLQTIDHVRQRFRVDSNRIFLAGHGTGGDACFDIAMSHPGVFAGAIPITGICDRYCTYYWDNDPNLSWYVIGGQKDRDSLERNARDLNKMMRRHDVIYCDYKDRGYESYYEEQPRLFEWMETKRRAPLSEVMRWGGAEGQVGSLRKSDNRFYWLEAGAPRDELFKPIIWDAPQRRVRLVPYEGTITPGGTIYVRHPGQATTIWLSPELVDFDERIKVNINGQVVMNDFVSPSIADMLEELRLHGDRERLFWARLQF